eukprot:9763836-Alexandrium_andersonii.AAC.1
MRLVTRHVNNVLGSTTLNILQLHSTGGIAGQASARSVSLHPKKESHKRARRRQGFDLVGRTEAHRVPEA